MFGKTGHNHSRFGKFHSAATKAKISQSMNKKVFVYTLDSDSKSLILHKSFNSCAEAAKYFNCSTCTITNYLDKNKLYKRQWILTSSETRS